METKLRIIEELEKVHRGIHLRELSRRVKSGLPNVRRLLLNLEKERVVEKTKEANLVIFRLKESEKTIAYLKQMHTERFLALPSKVRIAIIDLFKEIQISPLIALTFGSYAKGYYTQKSDVDLLLVFQRIENSKEIENAAERISARTNTKLSIVYVSYSNFKKNFLDKKHDFSREIRQNVIITYGVEHYYRLLWRFLE